MLSTKNVQKIVNNFTEGRRTVIANHSYSLQNENGEWYIVRCKKGDENRMWIDPESKIVTCWTRIYRYEPKTGDIYPL